VTVPSTSALEPVPEDWERALAIVAHPDDLEYGVASAVARWTSSGKTVTYLLVTRGEAGIDGMEPGECARVREEEERRGAAVVGVDTVEFLDGYTDGIVEYDLRLRKDLARAMRRHRPDVLVTINHREGWGPGTSNMADHRNVGLAVIDAARDAGNRWVFTDLVDDGLEPWDGAHRILVGGSPLPTHAVDVTDTLDLGVRSLEAHSAYLRGLGEGGMADPDAFLRGNAEATAERFGDRLATSFEMISW
jgi:LmbE family N-acetylglucosaminyl deacetylase